MNGGEAGRKAWEALALFDEGKSYDEIAAIVGYAPRSGGAFKAVQRALAQRSADLDALAQHGQARAQGRYARLFKEAAERALSGADDAVKWMRHAIQLADRLANIEGVKPPEQVVRVTMQNELDQEIEGLMEAFNRAVEERSSTDADG